MALRKRGVFYHYHFWVNGKRYRGSTKKTTLAAARQVESRLMAAAEEEGDWVTRRRSLTLREFQTRFFDWIEQSKLAEKSKTYYASGWRLLAETKVASMTLNAISRDDAEGLTFSGGPSNHNNALRTLRRMLSKAVDWKVLKAAPKIKLLVENERKRMIDAHTEAQLLPFLKQPLLDVLMIMRDSGMRNHKEVFTMRWEYVDWANDRYYVYASKSPKGRRYVPLSPRVKRALLSRCMGEKEGWVFPEKRAKCGHLTTVTKAFQKARDQAKLPRDLVLYCARHGFGTEMYRATKNLFAVMNVMGHAAVSTTMKYQHQDIDEVAAVASQRIQ
ncbi:MAG TPA: tyrosine-type recombinase/integrase [Candidatus Angelobacter sp.]|nr:tyrosine-type recombinase/integrase [Candidatus Angelobacter sp.]